MTKRQELEKRLAEITAKIQAEIKLQEEIEMENKRPWPLGPWEMGGMYGIYAADGSCDDCYLAHVYHDGAVDLIKNAPDLYEKLNDIVLEWTEYGSVDYQTIASAKALLDSVLNGE